MIAQGADEMDKKFIVHRGDRAFVLYAGLLAEAHTKGLQSIVTAMQQAPTPENGETAIVSTAVTIEQEGSTRLFTGIGDASPANVNPAMLTCLLRMAETRAKARALRDAINVAMCSFEELNGEEGEQSGNAIAQRQQHRTSQDPHRQPTAAPLRTIPGGKCPDCGTTGKYHAPTCPQNPVAQRTA